MQSFGGLCKTYAWINFCILKFDHVSTEENKSLNTGLVVFTFFNKHFKTNFEEQITHLS